MPGVPPVAAAPLDALFCIAVIRRQVAALLEDCPHLWRRLKVLPPPPEAPEEESLRLSPSCGQPPDYGCHPLVPLSVWTQLSWPL